ncbi:hypothetical protein AOL_s00079g251 [Orbilia oligospora ATCC 24927]|uniref:Uncharacterized protein n=1 Tax=Arthrobotrys oligospora (strain ATCC 24927 / CBS 115.81 / DSM 1491) TaxID=756982 RepID=G1XCT1_ARTOA|nr:hypothetical protein AOL_s00079g251 [Orbilia oligospora ATCC 24927]EGX49030.1 hypothetical protein AOL_s00079g251 [Orbilia oligospora ATCC 24927]
MPSFLQRIGLKKKKFGKSSYFGKTTTADLPTAAVTKDASDIPEVPAPRRSFDSRASGSIISIPRSTNTIEDYDDLKPWKKRKNKRKQAHRGNAETLTEQMRRDFIAMQHKIDRIESYVVPKTPTDAFNLDDQNTTIATNDVRTFIECAKTIYYEGKEPNARTDSVPETPDEIRNTFVSVLERCKDPEFLFKLSQKIFRKYGTGTADAGPSERSDLSNDTVSEPSSRPKQTVYLPQIEYGVRHETEACEIVPNPRQLIRASEPQPQPKPNPIPGELVPIATHLLRTRINATKRQRGELMPHLPIPFGPSPPPIDQTGDRPSQEPKYLGLHDLYAENCIEKLENQATQMAELPRIYTENVAVERTGSRPQIEATVSKPNTLTKPDEPTFKSSSEDIIIDDETLDLENLSISKPSLPSPFEPLQLQQKIPNDSSLPSSFSDCPVVFPMSFPDPNFDEVFSEDEDEEDTFDPGCSIRYRGQNSEQTSSLAASEPQPEEQQIQLLDNDRTQIGDDACYTAVSNGCEPHSDNHQVDDVEDEDEDQNEDEEDETAAQLSAIHLLILLKVIAKRQNESQNPNHMDQPSSNSSGSSTPSDSSEESGSSSNSSASSQNLSVSSSTGNGASGSSKKRKQEDDPNRNGNDPDRPPPKKAAIEMIRDILRRFACPYAAGKPDEHPGCQMINRQNLSGLKEHVKRKHFNNVLPKELRIAKNWNEVFLYCHQDWSGAIPSPYISDMFLTANNYQPLTFEPSSIIESPINDGRYRPIVPLLSSPILGGPSSSTNVSGPLSEPLTQVHNHNAGNYDARPKLQSEPTLGQEMIDFLTTGGFDSIYHLLPSHLQSINPDDLAVPTSFALEGYMQSNFGIDVNQTRSQLMTPEFANDLNMLFQQPEVSPQGLEDTLQDEVEEVHNQQNIIPPAHITQTLQAVDIETPPHPPPTIKLQLETPSYINTTMPLPPPPPPPPPVPAKPKTTSNQTLPFVSPELSQCLDYLFADSKPYLKTQRPKSRLSRSSSSSSSSPPSSSSSSFLLPDLGTQTPDTLLSERNSLDLPPPSSLPHLNPKPPSPKGPQKPSKDKKRKKIYSLHIRYKPKTPGSPHQCATFSFNADNEYLELKLAFNDWMTNTFFPNNNEFSWDTWELEDTVDHGRITSLEALVQDLPFTWTAFRTTEAAFLLVPK